MTMSLHPRTRRSVLILLILTLTASSAAKPHECAVGWGNNDVHEESGSVSQFFHGIPESFINDGYCDCPLDGSDEPDTDACSGSNIGGWAGVEIPSEDLEKSDSPVFAVCAQQPNILLPHSRIHDGVCDCCDGSDERESVGCPDECKIVLAMEIKNKIELQTKFAVGYERRMVSFKEFDALRLENEEKSIVLEEEIPFMSKEVLDLERSVMEDKSSWVIDRREVMRAAVEKMQEGVLMGLSEEELINLMIGLCQLEGEKKGGVGASDKKKVCWSLKIGAMELGFGWGDDGALRNWDAEATEDENNLIVELFVKALIDGEGKMPKEKPSRPVKKKEVQYDDTDDDEDFYSSDDLDDYNSNDPESYDAEYYDGMDESESKEPVEEEQPVELEQSVEPEQPEIISRSYFEHRAQAILDEIDQILNFIDLDDTSGDEEEGEIFQTPAKIADNLDPIGVQQVRSELQSRVNKVQNGKEYAKLARGLLDSITGHNFSRDELIRLATATLYHSGITSPHLVELLFSILSPATDQTAEEDSAAAHTCSPDQHRSRYCLSELPVITRIVDNIQIQVPSQPFLDAFQASCEIDTTNDSQQTCDASTGIIIPDVIPSKGSFLGYTPLQFLNQLQKGDPVDPLVNYFDSLLIHTKSSPRKSSFLKNEFRVAELYKEIEHLENKLSTLQQQIGFPERKYGKHGELHSVRDECYTIESGAYEYEICVFGKATQRDRGETNRNSGTRLGSWSAHDYSLSDDGEKKMIWKFSGGQKCWQGPSRTAEIQIRCGEGVRLVSANEPETCTYVFEMEAYFMCDDEFARKNGLDVPVLGE